MKIRIISDLHVEFQSSNFMIGYVEHVNMILPPQPEDRHSVLIIAGDLAPIKEHLRITLFLEIVEKRFKHVIYIFGNHEFYGTDFESGPKMLEQAISIIPNFNRDKLTIAGNDIKVVTVEDTKFICGTLWTDYNKSDPITMFMATRYMADFRAIKKNIFSKITPADILEIHKTSLGKIQKELNKNVDNSKTVVVTHHMPSMEAVHEQYKGDEESYKMNGCFASALDYMFNEANAPKFWVFGHTHMPTTMTIDNTTIICNPFGYPNENNLAQGLFNPVCWIET